MSLLNEPSLSNLLKNEPQKKSPKRSQQVDLIPSWRKRFPKVWYIENKHTSSKLAMCGECFVKHLKWCKEEFCNQWPEITADFMSAGNCNGVQLLRKRSN